VTRFHIGHNESRCFTNADGSVKNFFNYNWNDPANISTEGTLPNERGTFWNKIEAIWTMRE